MTIIYWAATCQYPVPRGWTLNGRSTVTKDSNNINNNIYNNNDYNNNGDDSDNDDDDDDDNDDDIDLLHKL